MYYYDEDGDLAWTEDGEYAKRHAVLHLLKSHSYPLLPEAAGRLFRAMGTAPIEISRAEALRAIHSALKELGYDGLRLEDVLTVVDGSWKLAIEVGN